MVTLSKLDIALGLAIIFLINFLIYNHFFRTEDKDSDVKQGVEIHEIIEKVRSELRQADNDRIDRDETALFEVKSFDLEINFIAKTIEKQEGGLKTELLAVSGGIENSLEKVQKVNLHLTAIPPQEFEIPPISNDTSVTKNPKH